ncbi:MAG: hypothetical protein GY913_10310 [Proteobacteria bacterium]|nr:hypothetical protein [Pseudomonadota bacterium]MCP4917305.1 hypothetical protein [Pseudomonadota bacterium]
MFLLLSCFLSNPTAVQMDWHYEDLGAARDAVIRGDLVAYEEAIRMLGERTPVPSLPTDYSEDELELVLQVREARTVKTLDEAALQVGLIAANCANCHSRVGVELRLASSDPPMPDKVMQRHGWAVERISDGLIRGDVPAIERGALVLDFTPVVAMGGLAEDLQEELHDDASDIAHVGATFAERGRSYGEVLGSCAACHKETGGGPD